MSMFHFHYLRSLLIPHDQSRDPIEYWHGFRSGTTAELAELALRILSIVVNTAGCERVFSDMGEKKGDRCNRLCDEKVEKMVKVLRICLYLFNMAVLIFPSRFMLISVLIS
jgi:hypothetical protein